MSTNDVRPIWTLAVQRKNFSDSTSTFDGKPIEFPVFMDYLKTQFGGKSIGDLLLPEAMRPPIPAAYPPVMLDADGNEIENPMIMTARDRDVQIKVNTAREKVFAKYELGLSLITARLGSKTRSEVAELAGALGPWNLRYNSVFDGICTKYKEHPEVTVLELQKTIQHCPMAKNVAEALLLVTMINDTDMDLKFFDEQYALTEQEKSWYVMTKLDPKEFKDLIMNMQTQPNSPAYTFAEIRTQIETMETTARVLATHHSYSSSEGVPDSSSTMADPGAAASLVNSTSSSGQKGGARSGVTCRNCKGDHSVKECPHPCKAGRTDTCLRHHVHGTQDCPEFKQFLAQRQSSSQRGSTSQRSQRSGSNGRGSGSDGKRSSSGSSIFQKVMNDNRQVKKARRRVNEVYASKLVDQDDGSEGDYDSYDDYDYRVVNAMATANVMWSPAYLDAHACLAKFFLSRPVPRPFVEQAVPRLFVEQQSTMPRPRRLLVPDLVRHDLLEKTMMRHAAVVTQLHQTWLVSAQKLHLQARGYVLDLQQCQLRVFVSRESTWERYRQPVCALLSLTAARWVPQGELERLSTSRRWRQHGASVSHHQVQTTPVVGCGDASESSVSPHPSQTTSDTGCAVLSSNVSWAFLHGELLQDLAHWSAEEARSEWLRSTTLDKREGRTRSVSMARAWLPQDEGALTEAMYDTGANLSITNPHLAVMLDLDPVQWPRPVPITFGNATEAVSTHYVHLGPLLGRVALVEDAPSTILTRQSLQEGGLSVLFRYDGTVRIFDMQDRVVFEDVLSPTVEFLMLPLAEFMPPHLIEQLHQYQMRVSDDTQKVFPAMVNGRRRSPPVTAAEVADVMALHERMYHPSSAVMARALRAGAWPGVTLDATLVERVFRHQDCLFCALGKMKRLPRCEGSTLSAAFGDEVSMDYVPVTTVAKGGFKGAYVAVERTTGYAWVYLTARHNGVQMLKAVEAVRLSLSSHGHRLKMLRTDAGVVEAGLVLATQLAERHVVVNAAAPEAQYQNFVERFIQTAARGLATTLLAQRFLDNSFWGMALLAWVRAWNCRPNEASGEYSPEFALTGRHPCVDTQFRIPFGTAVASRKMESNPRASSVSDSSKQKPVKPGKESAGEKFKFAPPGELGFVVGNTASMNGASLVYVPKKGRNVSYPRVDVQVIHTGESPATEMEIKHRLEELTMTSEGLKLPVPVTAPVLAPSSDPLSADSSKSGPDEEQGVPFEEMYASQESAVMDANEKLAQQQPSEEQLALRYSPDPQSPRGALVDPTLRLQEEEAELAALKEPTPRSPVKPAEVISTEDNISAVLVSSEEQGVEEEDQKGADDVISGPAANTRSAKRLFSHLSFLPQEESRDDRVSTAVGWETEPSLGFKRVLFQRFLSRTVESGGDTISDGDSDMEDGQPPPALLLDSSDDESESYSDMESESEPPELLYDSSDDDSADDEYFELQGWSAPRRVNQAVVQTAQQSFSDDMPTITKALKSDRAAEWIVSIEQEIQNLLNHNTGTEVRREDVPAGAQILPIKVVLKLKRDTFGVPTKFKARFCVLGNLKWKSSLSVFSPTANEKSLKFLLALATALGLWVVSIDVYGAFLYPDMKELVFVQIPPTVTGGKDVIWKLNKTMYGLDLSPRAYYDHVSAHLLKGGYMRCSTDPCFFWKKQGDVNFLLAVVHVDDFAVAATDVALVEELIKHLETVYTVSVTRDLEHYVGIHVGDIGNGQRTMSQPGLLKKMFEKYPEVQTLPTYPQVPMSTLFNDVLQDDSPRCDSTAYMELLGSLMYMEKTRADISFAVNRLSMRTKKCTVRDYNALLRVLAYLFATKDKAIVLKPVDVLVTTPGGTVAPLEAWCDASYAIHEMDGRSHSGYGFRLANTGSGLFYARSTKQVNVALSSTEAELNAAVECAKDIMWFRQLRADIGLPEMEPTVIYVDNASLITLASNYSGNHKRVKHFLVRLNFLIDLVDRQQIRFVKVDTSLNSSDGLTKPLGPMEFNPKTASLLEGDDHHGC